MTPPCGPWTPSSPGSTRPGVMIRPLFRSTFPRAAVRLMTRPAPCTVEWEGLGGALRAPPLEDSPRRPPWTPPRPLLSGEGGGVAPFRTPPAPPRRGPPSRRSCGGCAPASSSAPPYLHHAPGHPFPPGVRRTPRQLHQRRSKGIPEGGGQIQQALPIPGPASPRVPPAPAPGTPTPRCARIPGSRSGPPPGSAHPRRRRRPRNVFVVERVSLITLNPVISRNSGTCPNSASAICLAAETSLPVSFSV